MYNIKLLVLTILISILLLVVYLDYKRKEHFIDNYSIEDIYAITNNESCKENETEVNIATIKDKFKITGYTPYTKICHTNKETSDKGFVDNIQIVENPKDPYNYTVADTNVIKTESDYLGCFQVPNEASTDDKYNYETMLNTFNINDYQTLEECKDKDKNKDKLIYLSRKIDDSLIGYTESLENKAFCKATPNDLNLNEIIKKYRVPNKYCGSDNLGGLSAISIYKNGSTVEKKQNLVFSSNTYTAPLTLKEINNYKSNVLAYYSMEENYVADIDLSTKLEDGNYKIKEIIKDTIAYKKIFPNIKYIPNNKGINFNSNYKGCFRQNPVGFSGRYYPDHDSNGNGANYYNTYYDCRESCLKKSKDSIGNEYKYFALQGYYNAKSANCACGTQAEYDDMIKKRNDNKYKVISTACILKAGTAWTDSVYKIANNKNKTDYRFILKDYSGNNNDMVTNYNWLNYLGTYEKPNPNLVKKDWNATSSINNIVEPPWSYHKNLSFAVHLSNAIYNPTEDAENGKYIKFDDRQQTHKTISRCYILKKKYNISKRIRDIQSRKGHEREWPFIGERGINAHYFANTEVMYKSDFSKFKGIDSGVLQIDKDNKIFCNSSHKLITSINESVENHDNFLVTFDYTLQTSSNDSERGGLVGNPILSLSSNYSSNTYSENAEINDASYDPENETETYRAEGFLWSYLTNYKSQSSNGEVNSTYNGKEGLLYINPRKVSCIFIKPDPKKYKPGVINIHNLFADELLIYDKDGMELKYNKDIFFITSNNSSSPVENLFFNSETDKDSNKYKDSKLWLFSHTWVAKNNYTAFVIHPPQIISRIIFKSTTTRKYGSNHEIHYHFKNYAMKLYFEDSDFFTKNIKVKEGGNYNWSKPVNSVRVEKINLEINKLHLTEPSLEYIYKDFQTDFNINSDIGNRLNGNIDFWNIRFQSIEKPTRSVRTILYDKGTLSLYDTDGTKTVVKDTFTKDYFKIKSNTNSNLKIGNLFFNHSTLQMKSLKVFGNNFITDLKKKGETTDDLIKRIINNDNKYETVYNKIKTEKKNLLTEFKNKNPVIKTSLNPRYDYNNTLPNAEVKLQGYVNIKINDKYLVWNISNNQFEFIDTIEPCKHTFYKEINVGNSPAQFNTKTIDLDESNLYVDPTPINNQIWNWEDTFTTNVIGNKLTVTRIDRDYGWGQILKLNAYKQCTRNYYCDFEIFHQENKHININGNTSKDNIYFILQNTNFKNPIDYEEMGILYVNNDGTFGLDKTIYNEVTVNFNSKYKTITPQDKRKSTLFNFNDDNTKQKKYYTDVDNGLGSYNFKINGKGVLEKKNLDETVWSLFRIDDNINKVYNEIVIPAMDSIGLDEEKSKIHIKFGEDKESSIKIEGDYLIYIDDNSIYTAYTPIWKTDKFKKDNKIIALRYKGVNINEFIKNIKDTFQGGYKYSVYNIGLLFNYYKHRDHGHLPKVTIKESMFRTIWKETTNTNNPRKNRLEYSVPPDWKKFNIYKHKNKLERKYKDDSNNDKLQLISKDNKMIMNIKEDNNLQYNPIVYPIEYTDYCMYGDILKQINTNNKIRIPKKCYFQLDGTDNKYGTDYYILKNNGSDKYEQFKYSTSNTSTKFKLEHSSTPYKNVRLNLKHMRDLASLGDSRKNIYIQHLENYRKANFIYDKNNITYPMLYKKDETTNYIPFYYGKELPAITIPKMKILDTETGNYGITDPKEQEKLKNDYFNITSPNEIFIMDDLKTSNLDSTNNELTNIYTLLEETQDTITETNGNVYTYNREATNGYKNMDSLYNKFQDTSVP